jgi:hypothetical protein
MQTNRDRSPDNRLLLGRAQFLAEPNRMAGIEFIRIKPVAPSSPQRCPDEPLQKMDLLDLFSAYPQRNGVAVL